eukprot:TRINITY_DN67750_c1_g1_i1.p2 TRINITY_DN67750_c1_g1~~TRINITY_DN67750_c1_g1_i1.p2  ORF type:complete len:107 (-),score=4.50 TRINITY_DN67750_c1_g1_i1:637-957(-)
MDAHGANRINSAFREFCWNTCRVAPVPLPLKRKRRDRWLGRPLNDKEKEWLESQPSPEQKQANCYERCHDYAFAGVNAAYVETVLSNKKQMKQMEEMTKMMAQMTG